MCVHTHTHIYNLIYKIIIFLKKQENSSRSVYEQSGDESQASFLSLQVRIVYSKLRNTDIIYMTFTIVMPYTL